jgi:hypothetical protein
MLIFLVYHWFFSCYKYNSEYLFQGFGAGNFKALFEAIEAEQSQRGNLWEFVIGHHSLIARSTVMPTESSFHQLYPIHNGIWGTFQLSLFIKEMGEYCGSAWSVLLTHNYKQAKVSESNWNVQRHRMRAQSFVGMQDSYPVT